MLDERKQRAIVWMTLGRLSGAKAAKAAGVKPGTLYAWKHDPEFRAELERWRNGPPIVRESTRQTLRVLADELARRALALDDETPIRDLISIFDRVQKLNDITHTEEDHDDADLASLDELTPEQAERLLEALEKEDQEAADAEASDDA